MADDAGRASGNLPIIFGPALALGAFAALLAMVADYVGWHRDLMHLAAIGVGTVVLALAIAYFSWQASQRKTANRALHGAEARVDNIVESAMDAVITVDENQRIKLFNAAAEKVFGYPRAEVLGQTLDMLMPILASVFNVSPRPA